MKKFISLFLVFSILALSMPLIAKERKGADLIIQETDGTQVRGELIAVKQTSLLLLERDFGADVTVDVGDIRIIRIVKKGALYGLLVGVGSGVLAGISSEINEEDPFLVAFLVYGILIGIPVALIVGKDKPIQIEGMTDSEIKEILEKLRKKARIRNSQ
ncbi:MAG: hypothetical protein V3S65_06235 [Candidatus Aminicenantaceae bacterium]